MPTSLRSDPVCEFGFCRNGQARGVAMLAQQAFPKIALNLEDRVKLYERWIASLGAPIMSVRFNAVEVGFSCVLPLTEGAYGQYRKGAMRDLDFTATHFDLSNAATGLARFICIQAILLNQPLQREVWEFFKSALLSHLTYFNSEPEVSPPLLIAEGATVQGVRLLKKSGFALLGIAAGGAPLYELDLGYTSIEPQGSRTRKLLIETAKLRLRCNQSPSAYEGTTMR